MPKLTVVGRDGVEHVVEGRVGSSMMQAISEAGVTDVFGICGGCASCGTCQVYVDPEFAPRLLPLSEDERALLDVLDNRRPASRLSCQLSLTAALDGMRVTIAPQE
jgi:2Fe-2S ferredoxin